MGFAQSIYLMGDSVEGSSSALENVALLYDSIGYKGAKNPKDTWLSAYGSVIYPCYKELSLFEIEGDSKHFVTSPFDAEVRPYQPLFPGDEDTSSLVKSSTLCIYGDLSFDGTYYYATPRELITSIPTIINICLAESCYYGNNSSCYLGFKEGTTSINYIPDVVPSMFNLRIGIRPVGDNRTIEELKAVSYPGAEMELKIRDWGKRDPSGINVVRGKVITPVVKL